MKTRNGFVSNSSSSSFIIHKSAIGEKDFNFIVDTVRKALIKEKEESHITYHSWGDNGETYNVQGEYIFVETHNAPENVRNLVKKYENKAYVIYG